MHHPENQCSVQVGAWMATPGLPRELSWFDPSAAPSVGKRVHSVWQWSLRDGAGAPKQWQVPVGHQSCKDLKTKIWQDTRHPLQNLRKAHYSPENLKATHKGLCPWQWVCFKPRKGLRSPELSPLTDVKSLCRQQAKAMTEFWLPGWVVKLYL